MGAFAAEKEAMEAEAAGALAAGLPGGGLLEELELKPLPFPSFSSQSSGLDAISAVFTKLRRRRKKKNSDGLIGWRRATVLYLAFGVIPCRPRASARSAFLQSFSLIS